MLARAVACTSRVGHEPVRQRYTPHFLQATSLRARFGVDATRNVAHGSASAAAAFGELKFFFPNGLVEPLPSSKQAKEYVAETLTPALTAGLVALCRAKPTNPAEFLAHYLLENNRRAA